MRAKIEEDASEWHQINFDFFSLVRLILKTWPHQCFLRSPRCPHKKLCSLPIRETTKQLIRMGKDDEASRRYMSSRENQKKPKIAHTLYRFFVHWAWKTVDVSFYIKEDEKFCWYLLKVLSQLTCDCQFYSVFCSFFVNMNFLVFNFSHTSKNFLFAFSMTSRLVEHFLIWARKFVFWLWFELISLPLFFTLF